MIRRASPIRRTPIKRKFGNQPQHFAGQSFASKLEQSVYADLLLLEKAGEIRGLRREVTHQLYAGSGHAWCACQYSEAAYDHSVRIYAPRLDFQFEEKQAIRAPHSVNYEKSIRWQLIFADAKGFQDAKQIMGYKLFSAIHGQEIRLYRKGGI